MLLRSATVLHLDPPGLETTCLRIDGERITGKGPDLSPLPGEPILDLAGRIVMPGLVVGHHHLYSSLARGMPPPAKTPTRFEEILSHVWWRLDQALDNESVYVSALVGTAEAAVCGVTTVIDHHASPNAIDGSLDHVRRGIEEIGLRGVLCYEVTDRHGAEGRERGLAENDRFLRSVQGPWFAGLVGAHAAFTMSDEALAACGRLAEAHRCGVHIHVAEDACDDAICRSRYGRSVFERLEAAGIVRPGTLLCHCTHLDPAAVTRARHAGCFFAHCPQSNMNNAVGYAPVAAMGDRAILGTDGISGDLFAEARTAWFKAQDAHAGLDAGAVVALLTRSARVASERLGVTLGRIEPGAMADLVFLDYDSPTPLEAGNVIGHVLFGLSARQVRQVWVGGRRVVDEGRVLRVMPERLGREARRTAEAVWRRMAALPA